MSCRCQKDFLTCSAETANASKTPYIAQKPVDVADCTNQGVEGEISGNDGNSNEQDDV